MGWIDKLLGAKPNTPQRQAEALNQKALKSITGNRLDEAEGLLLEAVRVAPDLSAAYHNLGALYLNQKRYAQAIKHIRRAVRLEPGDVESRIALAKVLGDMGKREESLAEYESICRDVPGDWRTQISMGNALLERDRLDEAIEYLEKAALLKPKEELTHLVLAAAYERQGEMEKAIKQYRAARNTTRVNQNRSAASTKMHELQQRLAEQRRSQGSAR
ncbi:MAG: tetratricopeptide repeat protein [Chloroflexota bacterium]